MLLLLMFGGIATAEKESDTALDTEASCILKISSDPYVLPLLSELIQSVFQSSGVYDEALKTVFGDISLNAGPNFNLEFFAPNLPPAAPGMPMGMMMGPGGGMGGGAMPGRVIDPYVEDSLPTMFYSLQISSEKGSAKVFMKELICNFKKAIEQPYIHRRNELMDQMNALNSRIEEKKNQVDQWQEQMNAMIVSGVTNREELRGRMNDLRREIQSHQVKQRISQDQLERFERDQAEIRNQMDRSLQEDNVLKELSSLVNEAEAAVERLKEQVNAGRIPEGQVSEAKQGLARAKIELARRAEELREKAGQKQLAELNERLQQGVTLLSESELLRHNAQEQLEETIQLFTQTGDLEILEMNWEVARDSLKNLMKTKFDIENQIETLKKPSVVVIGGTDQL
jgi:outer membrane murein-binding lipoprotein Lpp